MCMHLISPIHAINDDNPLALIVKYWKRGDIDTATQLTNTFTNTIYYDTNASDNKYFNEKCAESCKCAYFCVVRTSRSNRDYSKLTPNNLVELLSEIGGLIIKILRMITNNLMP